MPSAAQGKTSCTPEMGFWRFAGSIEYRQWIRRFAGILTVGNVLTHKSVNSYWNYYLFSFGSWRNVINFAPLNCCFGFRFNFNSCCLLCWPVFMTFIGPFFNYDLLCGWSIPLLLATKICLAKFILPGTGFIFKLLISSTLTFTLFRLGQKDCDEGWVSNCTKILLPSNMLPGGNLWHQSSHQFTINSIKLWVL
jgi:hypothetical protein